MGNKLRIIGYSGHDNFYYFMMYNGWYRETINGEKDAISISLDTMLNRLEDDFIKSSLRKVFGIEDGELFAFTDVLDISPQDLKVELERKGVEFG